MTNPVVPTGTTTALTQTDPNVTYSSLLQIANGSIGITASIQTVYDGNGNGTALGLSSGQVNCANVTFTGNTIALTSGALTVTPNTTFSGNVTISGTFTGTVVNTSNIVNGAVTYAKIQSETNNTILGNTSGGAASPSEIALPLVGANGGTGVANTGKTITLANSVTTVGNFPLTITSTNTTNATLPPGTVNIPSVSGTTTNQHLAVFNSTANQLIDSSIAIPASTTKGQVLRTGSTASTLVAKSYVHNETQQVFTASGTFNVPADVDTVFVEAWGAGGGGGGTTSSANTAGGGGAGAYAAGIVSVTPGGTVTVTIGTGGTSVLANTVAAGGNGGATSFGSLIIAAGGTGGGANAVIGGNGGTVAACTGTCKIAGGAGGGTSAAITYGYGGSSPRNTPIILQTLNQQNSGLVNSGQGGFGGDNAFASGAGGSGYMVVWY